MWYLYIAIVLLIMLSAFFSGAEMAMAKVNKLKLKKEAEEKKNAKAKLALSIAENFNETTSTVLIGNNLVNIASSSIATVICIDLFGANSGPTWATIIMTLLILTFGEIIPKSICSTYNYKMAKVTARPLVFCKYLFLPIVYPITKLISLIEKIWTPKEKEPLVTDEELIEMVDTIEEEGLIDEQKSELIKSAIEFTDVTAHEIMVPRVDVFAFNIEDDIQTLLDNEEVYNHSRIPVYEESLDNIVGILSVKKLLNAVILNQKIDIHEMMSEPLYVYKTQYITSILTELRVNHKHLAVIKDEFGGTMGILTMEDIIEELVGEILDENDVNVDMYQKIADNTYIVDGDMNIYDFFELTGLDSKDFESEYTTVGGWCTEQLEHFPEKGDSFDYENLEITIISQDEFRVEHIKVVVKEVEKELE